MDRYTVVKEYIPYKPLVAVLSGSIVAVLFIALVMYMNKLEILALAVLAVGLTVDLTAIAVIRYFYSKALSRLGRLEEIIESIEDNEVRFREDVEYRLGYLVLVGRWITTGKSSSYVSSMEFEELARGKGRKATFAPEHFYRYTVFVHSTGDGYMRVPALVIEDPIARGSAVVFIPYIKGFKEEALSLNVVYEAGDVASAQLYVRGDRLTGAINYIRKAKSRRLKLEFSATMEGVKHHGKLIATRTVAEAREVGEVSVDYRLNPDKPLAILVSSYRKANPLKIIRALKKGAVTLRPPLLYGYSDGRYSVKLILDLPFKADKYVEKPLELEPSL